MSQPVDIGRFELKYAVPTALRGRIVELARGHVKPDKHAIDLPAGFKGYEVHSLYLDTERLEDYRDRLAERKVRNRLRVRSYGPRERGPYPVFLENKRKLENWVVKSRVALPADSEVWCASREPEPWEPLLRQIRKGGLFSAEHFSRLTSGGVRIPVSVVHYEREVWVGLDPCRTKVRLTLDHGVTATTRGLRPASLYDPPDVDLLPPGWMVVELKFGGSKPGWMRRLCRAMQLRATPVSKFGLSVAKGVAGNRYDEVRYLTPRGIRNAGLGMPARHGRRNRPPKALNSASSEVRP